MDASTSNAILLYIDKQLAPLRDRIRELERKVEKLERRRSILAHVFRRNKRKEE